MWGIFLEYKNRADSPIYFLRKDPSDIQDKVESELKTNGFNKTGRLFRLPENTLDKVFSLPATYEELIFNSSGFLLVKLVSGYEIPVYRIYEEKKENVRIIFQGVSFNAARKNFLSLIEYRK